MDVTDYKFETFEGLPPDAEPGYFFGFDKDNQPYIFRWLINDDEAAWIAVSIDPTGAPAPSRNVQAVVHLLVGSNADKIVRYARTPMLWSELEKDWPAAGTDQ